MAAKRRLHGTERDWPPALITNHSSVASGAAPEAGMRDVVYAAEHQAARSDRVRVLRGDVPGQQLIESNERMVGDARDHMAQIRFRGRSRSATVLIRLYMQARAPRRHRSLRTDSVPTGVPLPAAPALRGVVDLERSARGVARERRPAHSGVTDSLGERAFFESDDNAISRYRLSSSSFGTACVCRPAWRTFGGQPRISSSIA